MRLKLLYLFCSLFLITSCSSSDDSATPPSDPVGGDFFPSSLNDSWTYDVTNTNDTDPTLNFNATDIVTIDTAGSSSYSTQVNSGTMPANGTTNALFDSGTFTKTNTNLIFNGDLTLPDDLELPVDFDISLTNFSVYDLNASDQDIIGSSSGVINDNVDFDGQSIPITINYTITNTKQPDLNSFVVNTVTYNTIIHTTIRVNITVTLDFGGFIGSQNLLNSQDVLVLDHYFAQDVGLIQSEADQSFMLNQTLLDLLASLPGGITIDFPTSGSSTNVQDLESFTVSSN